MVLKSLKVQLNNLSFDKKSGLLLLGNALDSQLVVLHVSHALDSFDAVTRFEAIVPIITLETLPAPSDSADAETLQVRLLMQTCGLCSGVHWDCKTQRLL